MIKDKRKPARLIQVWWNRLNAMAPDHMKGNKNRSLQVKWMIETMELHIRESYQPKRRGPVTKRELDRLKN